VQNAHCAMCGNFDIKRVPRDLVEGWYAPLLRLAHFPAYRCAPCRNRFFSLRPFHRIRTAEQEAAESRPAPPPPLQSESASH
jgi:hypothetical protein